MINLERELKVGLPIALLTLAIVGATFIAKRLGWVDGDAGVRLAMALGEHGITANMIPPGSIDTPMLRGAEIMQREGAVEAYGAALPVGRIGTGEDIAAAAAFLVSEEGGYMTGQTISVNGGRYMGSA